MYLLGKKPSTGHPNAGELLLVNDISKTISEEVAIANYITANGGAPKNIAYLDIGSDYQSPKIKRLRNTEDEVTIVWDGDVMTNFNFSTEDLKLRLTMSVDKNKIKGDGIDEANVSIKIINPDDSTDVFNDTLEIPIRTPFAQTTVDVIITNGTGSLKLKTAKSGEWTLGTKKFRNDLRVLNPLKIMVQESDLT